jgi:outer membrane protein assembly factor BamB
VFWESAAGKMLFCWGENGNLRAWHIDAHGVVTFAAAGPEVASGLGPGPSGLGGMPGGMLCLSADGDTPHTAVVWGLAPRDGDANMQVTPGILRAYDATQFDTNPDGSKKLRLLWDTQNFGNAVNFNHNKFGVPVVANGKVYVPTYDGRVDVYALR